MIVLLVLQNHAAGVVDGDDPGPALERAALRAQPVRFVQVAIVAGEAIPGQHERRPTLASHHDPRPELTPGPALLQLLGQQPQVKV